MKRWIRIGLVVALTLLVAESAGATVHVRGSVAAEDVPGTLKRQTQEILNAVTSGDTAIWDRYLAPDVVYADEEGTLNSKADLLAYIKPMAQGVSGKLEVEDFVTHLHGATANTCFRVEETENYHGQILHSHYRTTHVWVLGSGGWRLVASQSLAVLSDPPGFTLAPGQLDQYVGTYALTPEITYTIRRKGDGLEGQRTGRPAQDLKAEMTDMFFVPGQPRVRKVFQRDSSGQITAFVDRRESWDLEWKRVK